MNQSSINAPCHVSVKLDNKKQCVENINKRMASYRFRHFGVLFLTVVRGAVELNKKKRRGRFQRGDFCSVRLRFSRCLFWKQRKKRNEFQPLQRYLNPAESSSALLQATSHQDESPPRLKS